MLDLNWTNNLKERMIDIQFVLLDLNWTNNPDVHEDVMMTASKKGSVKRATGIASEMLHILDPLRAGIYQGMALSSQK